MSFLEIESVPGGRIWNPVEVIRTSPPSPPWIPSEVGGIFSGRNYFDSQICTRWWGRKRMSRGWGRSQISIPLSLSHSPLLLTHTYKPIGRPIKFLALLAWPWGVRPIIASHLLHKTTQPHFHVLLCPQKRQMQHIHLYKKGEWKERDLYFSPKNRKIESFFSNSKKELSKCLERISKTGLFQWKAII